MKQIKVTITDDAAVTVEASGFKGKQCDVASAIEQALGSTKSRKLKPEYHQPVAATQQIGGRNG